MAFQVKHLGVFKIQEPVNDFNFTEHLYSWLVNISEETISRSSEHLRFYASKSFSVKEENIEEAYRYNWRISLEKSERDRYKLSVWLESFSDRQSAEKKLYLSVTHVLVNRPAYQVISQNRPVDLCSLGAKTETEIPAEFFEACVSSQLPFNHQFNIRAKIFWRESARSTIDRLAADFARLHADRQGTDLTFVFDDQREVKVHKLVLTTRSSVFRAMFQNEMLESKQNRVHIKDMDPEIFEELVQYIYTGKIGLASTDKLTELMVVADKYDLNELKVCCEKEVKKNLSIETVSDVLVIAHLLELTSLKSIAINFILENKLEVLRTEGYKSLRENYIHLLAELFESNK